MGPDINDLKKFAKEKEKKEQYIKRLVAKGIIQPPQKLKPEEEIKKEEPIKNVFLDETGRMKDEKGNIINLKVVFYLILIIIFCCLSKKSQKQFLF